MKKLVFLLAVAVAIVSCGNKANKPADAGHGTPAADTTKTAPAAH